MQRIVLDTNSLIMSISSKSEYNEIWKSFLRGDYTLCITNEIIEEYQEVIARNINPWLAEIIVTTIINRNNVIKADTHFHFNLIQADKDDNKFVDCAIVTNARYIVTEDKHFNALRSISFPIVDVINIDAFLKILSTIIPQNR